MDTNELETLRGVCRLLIMRILEANAIRELLDESALKETKKVIPDLINGLMLSYKQNKERFDTQNVEPMRISDLSHFQEFASTCETHDLIRLAEVSRFVMEREIHKIAEAVISKQT